jgi:uncharacterized membrane protein
MIHTLRIGSMIFAAIAMIPAGAHLFALLNKMKLSKEEYLIAQRAYDGWSLFGFVVCGALLSTLALTILLYRDQRSYSLVLGSFLCLVGTQVIFWLFTFPMNKATQNWTILPDQWEPLRLQWELSHAGSAVLNFAALLFLFLSAMTR